MKEVTTPAPVDIPGLCFGAGRGLLRSRHLLLAGQPMPMSPLALGHAADAIHVC